LVGVHSPQPPGSGSSQYLIDFAVYRETFQLPRRVAVAC
jgi:hypothetical protein